MNNYAISPLYAECYRKDMSESVEPWFDKHAQKGRPILATPHQRIATRVGEWCLAIGLRRDLFLSCERLGMRLLDLGDEEETAVRKACEVASDLHNNRESK